MNLSKIIRGFRFKALGRSSGLGERIGRTDLGVLKVALMIAALDGEITAAEYEAFELLARKCRGYTPEGGAEALESALRSAGYLMLKARRATDAELVRAFIAEASAALPDGFAFQTLEDVRRALSIWVMMGLSDGDYSARERKCVEALRRRFAELKVTRAQQEAARRMAFTSEAALVHGLLVGSAPGEKIRLVTQDFVAEVERALVDAIDVDAAAKEFHRLIQDR